ncbi:hypothetical protein XcuCFBP2542_02125 [Xanthomonas cucurbitae]|uniref:Uncharacterized protein n=1 Tax=Xanthomonas cucurbitae TaxID=56453 RepID=A0A2S7DXE2_9XANT|nr:hypothetical protein XcuCFBP2542_02125 [Xanthomonas cucurbitae]
MGWESGMGNRESGIGNRESGIGNRNSICGAAAGCNGGDGSLHCHDGDRPGGSVACARCTSRQRGAQRIGTRPAPNAVSMRTSSHFGPTLTSGKSPTAT